MTSSAGESRAALDAWFQHAQADLERKDWRAAFGARYPRPNLEHDPVPWALPPSDLRSARLTVIDSSGLYLPGQRPFDLDALRGDFSWRPIPASASLAKSHLAHEHYDHTAADLDRNSVFPLDRLRELAADGEIGGLTETHVSFCGYIPDWAALVDHFAPALADHVAQQHADAVLLIPV